MWGIRTVRAVWLATVVLGGLGCCHDRDQKAVKDAKTLPVINGPDYHRFWGDPGPQHLEPGRIKGGII